MEAGHQPLRRLNAMVRSLQSLWLLPLQPQRLRYQHRLRFQLLRLPLNLPPPRWWQQHYKRFLRRFQRT